MRGAMSHKVGIWIDHRKAVIVSTSGGLVTTTTLQSEVEPHPRYSGLAGEAGGEKRYEARHAESLHHYYDAVIAQMGEPDAVLILGPGEAKLELEERLSRASNTSERTVDVETSAALTDQQLLAQVKEHFRIDR